MYTVHMTVQSWTATLISESTDAARSCPQTAVLKPNAAATHGNSNLLKTIVRKMWAYVKHRLLACPTSSQTVKQINTNQPKRQYDTGMSYNIKSYSRSYAGEVIPLV